MAMNIKKGDTIVVLSGKDKGDVYKRQALRRLPPPLAASA